MVAMYPSRSPAGQYQVPDVRDRRVLNVRFVIRVRVRVQYSTTHVRVVRRSTRIVPTFVYLVKATGATSTGSVPTNGCVRTLGTRSRGK